MEDRHALYQQFISRFPLGSLESMTLEQYTDLKRENSFCYWLEFKTRSLGGIRGGTSFKFGVYRYKERSSSQKVIYDDNYGWYRKFNVQTALEAFEIVKKAVVEIANSSFAGDFDVVENNKP